MTIEQLKEFIKVGVDEAGKMTDLSSGTNKTHWRLILGERLWFKTLLDSTEAVSIVRCKDCKYWDNHDGGERCLNTTAYLNWAEPNSFCSDGERKDEVK